MAERSGGWWCCCTSGCLVFYDSFNRWTDTYLGAQWREESGDWWVVGNPSEGYLWEAGTAGAKARSLVAAPSGSMLVYVNTIDERDHDATYVLIGGWDPDSDSYYDLTFTGGYSLLGTVEIGETVAGVRTVLARREDIPLTWDSRFGRELILCIEPGAICAVVSQALVESTLCVELAPEQTGYGPFAGLGNGGETEVVFDDFTLAKHFVDDEDCPVCICKCNDYFLQPELTATFFEATGRMIGLEGCSITLKWDALERAWIGDGVCCGEYWRIRMSCPISRSLEDFMLTIDAGCTDSDSPPPPLSRGQRMVDAAASFCRPLYLVFGNPDFFVSDSDLSCGCGEPLTESGTFKILVTD